jgi:putative ATP-dependent endonuclease of OLD family
MHITELRIRHFRNFMKARFSFRPGVNTLIGENGSGKTNALHALRLMLDETLERNAIYLRESDFCRDLGSWRAEWIVISADFAELDPSEGCQLLRHTTGHMDGSDSGTCTFFFRPRVDVRKRLHELSEERQGVASYIESLTIDDYEPVVTGRANGDFLDDGVYRRWVGDPELGDFPDPAADDQDVLGVRMQPIYPEVACTFVRALRDVIAELRSYRGNPLLTLLRGMESTIEIADAEQIAGKVKELNRDISTLKEIQGLADGIEVALKKTVGHTYGPNISIESALPDSMEKLLQRLIVLVGDGAISTYRGELHEQGLGGANLIYLALKLREYEAKLSSDRVAHFFLIEEPEAHIHTHIQKTLFSNLPSERTQVIVSTHSTHVSSASKIATVNVLARKGDHAEVYQPAKGLSSDAVSRLERYMDAVRSTLLFAKGVLLVEGDAEQMMIPAMLRAVFGMSPDELGFSVISMSSAFFEHVAVIFADGRIERTCAIVTDLDEALIDLATNPNDDTRLQAMARAAQKSGEVRYQKLQAFTEGNKWVQAFLAHYTFEVDFIGANNAREVVRTLDVIYKEGDPKNQSEQRLKSRDLQVAGTEILRLAAKCGKGWFALLLSEKLDTWTFIPEYILRAIAFACASSITDSSLKRMGEFRAKKHNSDGLKSLPPLKVLGRMKPPEFLSMFREADDSDALSLFCQYVEEYRDR